MKTLFTTLTALSICIITNGQQRIDGNFPFQTDPAKEYSIYVPSGYVAGTPHKLMLGLHPWNTSTWSSSTWCDTLTDFAETNNLLLVCPDGGADGQVDDPIDTAFTTALLDSMYVWYSVDQQKQYAMGFSWGGRTTYTYGLLRPNVFGGYLPIGAAINGTNEVGEMMQQNAAGKPVYIVHGSNDSPNTRFYPIRDSLTSKGAILNSLLMSGVGHTINFPNRNQILSVAYQWIDSVHCANISTSVSEVIEENNWNAMLYPSVAPRGSQMTLRFETDSPGVIQLGIYDVRGTLLKERNLKSRHGLNEMEIQNDLAAGTYFLVLSSGTDKTDLKFVIE